MAEMMLMQIRCNHIWYRTFLSEAACLSGDTDKQCIGIYKLPVINKNDVDAMESVGNSTQENLKAYAPDIRWVHVSPIERPNSIVEARI